MDLMESIPIVGPTICNDYLPGNGCELPMKPGHYGLALDEDPFILPVINFPDFILGYLLGTWELKVEIYDQNLNELMCITTILQYV